MGFDSNFIGEKIVRRVTMLEGVTVEISKNQKDELLLTGNSLQNVSQSAADIQQICRVRNKDIRKVGIPESAFIHGYKSNMHYSSWMACTCQNEGTLRKHESLGSSKQQ